MRSLPSHSSQIIRRLAALTIALWLGGLGCLIGCEINVSAASDDERNILNRTSSSCPLSSGHTCCHSAKDNRERPSADTTPQSTDTMSCCPFAGESAVVSKPRITDSLALISTANRVLSAPNVETYSVRLTNRSLLPDRGSTYLLHCVFLI